MAKKIVRRSASSNVFVADLSQFKLSEAQAKNIESQIQQIVMRELGSIDNGGFIVPSKSIFDGIRTRGIYPYPIEKIKDLTNQMKDVLKNQTQGF